ncbi:MAG TPA: UDP-N-acetylmuramoyl-L-alanine--D-glutamate ligase [Candidatus Acidoferrum sp.]|nr:UDP-N-acetylmuramoyl-L-alanine--D-glutamate ligase [Candidatus Acidoferrum sp.]
MFALDNKNVLVVGLGVSGIAAAELCLSRGAHVFAVDTADNPELQEQATKLRARGVNVELGATKLARDWFDLAVLSPGVPLDNEIVLAVRSAKIPLIGELELGYQFSLVLNISITGTNGKTTTTELVERVLLQNRLKTVAAGNIGTPLSAVADRTRSLDFVTLEVSSFQLETIQFFRPAVAVLMNITPDHLDRYASMDDYARAKARLFENQQAFDWAIIQSDALKQLQKLGVNVPSKIITFSATDQMADLYLDRGLIISRIENWSGPLLNMEDVQLRGPHNAENIMATLAVGRVLRIPLEGIVAAIKSYTPAPHRCEFVGEVNDVRFVNDSKATNVDAVVKALMSMPRHENSREPNVWLLAGGKDKGFDYHDAGPLISQRVKGAFLFGETREKIRGAWSLFTPCATVSTLLEALAEAVKLAKPGDVVLLSPACSSFDQFRNYQHRGDMFREAVKKLGKGNSSAATKVVRGDREHRRELMMF